MEEANLDFLKTKMNIDMNLSNTNFTPDINDVKVGDVLLIRILDGLDPMIMWGTGSTVSHVAMFLNFSDGMYVVESTDKNPFGKSYWPPPYGFIKTPYNEWFELEKKAEYDVRLLRLREDYREVLISNLDNVYEWWNKYEGSPYGYHNLLWGWIDTPNDNFPKPLTKEFLSLTLSFMERRNILTDILKSWFLDAFNKRISDITNMTSNKTYFQILDWCSQNNLFIWDLWSLRERDDWLYDDEPSRVCDTMVLSLLKEGKVIPLEDKIDISEFTPRDLYQLNLWENWDEENFTLQVLGKYNLSIQKWNTIEPYQNMNENCPSISPEYNRPKYC